MTEKLENPVEDGNNFAKNLKAIILVIFIMLLFLLPAFQLFAQSYWN